MLDDSLRDQLADWVRPVAALPVPDLRVLRRRARRRGIRRVSAVFAVVAVLASGAFGALGASGAFGAFGVSAGHPASPSWGAAPGTWTHGVWRAAGPLPATGAAPAVAPYLVLQTSLRGTIQVRNVFTAQTITTMSPPAGQRFIDVAAAGDDRTFVVVAQKGGLQPWIVPRGKIPPEWMVFYELRLKADGQPESLGRLFTLRGSIQGFISISADASMLAYSTDTGVFETVSLATGTGRAWPRADDGEVDSEFLSWAGDRTLVFEWTSDAESADRVQPANAGLRVLDVTAPGTMLQASRLIMPFGRYCSSVAVCRGGVLATADGSRVLVTRSLTDHGYTTGSVVEVSARTGQVVATVVPAVRSLTPGPNCVPMWTDPSGEQTVGACGHAVTYDRGRISPITVHPPMYGTNYLTFAW